MSAPAILVHIRWITHLTEAALRKIQYVRRQRSQSRSQGQLQLVQLCNCGGHIVRLWIACVKSGQKYQETTHQGKRAERLASGRPWECVPQQDNSHQRASVIRNDFRTDPTVSANAWLSSGKPQSRRWLRPRKLSSRIERDSMAGLRSV